MQNKYYIYLMQKVASFQLTVNLLLSKMIQVFDIIPFIFYRRLTNEKEVGNLSCWTMLPADHGVRKTP